MVKKKKSRPFFICVQTLKYSNNKICLGIISSGKNELSNTIKELKPARQEELLKCATVWNMNSKNSEAAQVKYY